MQLTLFALILLFAQSLAQNHPWISQVGDAGWLRHHEQLVNQTIAHKSDIEIVFLGASITEFWGSYGKDVWEKHYTPRHAYNYGVSGDQTQHVIWRTENGEFDGVMPKAVVLHIGK